MGTQYNPNPDGTESTGWSLLNVTRTSTGDGVRLRKTVTGIGGATLQFAVPGSGRLTLAGVRITRNSDDPLPEVFVFGRNAGVTEAFHNLANGWGAKGVEFLFPPFSTPTSTSGSAYITINSNAKFDITIRNMHVYALGDSAIAGQTPDLDSGDAAWTLTVPNNALKATAKWVGSPNEYVEELEWKASSGSTPQLLDAGLSVNHTRNWTYSGAGQATASLTVRNFSGDSYKVEKVFQVPSGTYLADFDHEADYLHVEVDGNSSIGAVIEKYSWNWGDSSSTLNQNVPYASHTYATPGTYFVQLTITNAMGQSSTTGHSVMVQTVPVAPLDFTVEHNLLTITATSLTTGASYAWDFGDGGVATAAQATHTYATAGTYVVVLTVDGDSISQSVTVTETYVALDIVDAMRLEVRQDPGDIVPWNRIPNPSGATGSWGWATPNTEFSGITAGPQGLRLEQGAGEAQSVATESVFVPVLPGRYVTGSFQLVQVDAPCYVRARVYIVDDNEATVATTTITAYQNTPGTYWTGPVKVPSTGRYAILGLLLYGSAGPTIPAVGAGFTWRQAQIASSLYVSEVTNPPYSEAGVWADVLGPTHEIAISRSELDVSTLTATILDAELDPSVSDTIRPGADIRLRVATERDGLRVWEPVYTGRLLKGTATYAASSLEEPALAAQELVINPTLTDNVDTYEVVDGARFALAPTVDGGQVTLTGYATSNVYYYAATLKVPVVEGRDYRIRIRARRVSGGWAESFRMYLRAFDDTDVDLGDARADRFDPPDSGVQTVTNDVAWNITGSSLGAWRDNEILVRAAYMPAGASTLNLWLCPVGNGTTSPNGVYTFTDVSVVEEWSPPALPRQRKSTRVTLQAHDAAATLAQTDESTAVATLQELPPLMEWSGVPVTVDGTGNTGPDPVTAAVNDNASLLDAVVAARDTQAGYAHVSRGGVLTLQTAQAVSTLPAAILDGAAYSSADATFDTEDVINSVVVVWLRWDPTAGDAGETVETRYGPYEDLASIRRWGLHREEFVWVGQVENVPAIEAQAAAILAANKTPARRAHNLTLPIRYATDLSRSRALLDLMDLVRVQHTRTGIDQHLRVTEVKHTITARNGRTPARWLMSVGFDAEGTVARPIAIPKPPPSSSVAGVPHAYVYKTASTANFAVANTKIDLTGNRALRGGMTNSGGSVTVPKAGVYSIDVWAHIQSTSTTGSKTFSIRTGATILASYSSKFDATNESDHMGLSVYLPAGAVVDFWLDHSGPATGVTVYGNASSFYTCMTITYDGP